MTDSALVFDVETWVDWPFVRRPEFLDPFLESYEAPKTLKDPIKIAVHHTKHWTDERRRWTFSPLTARVCSIAWADLWGGPVAAIADDDEAVVLKTFADVLTQRGGPPMLVGFNVRRFDIPFLTVRASILDVELPHWWPRGNDYRQVADLCDLTDRGGLDQWLLRCDLPRKTGSGEHVEYMPLSEIEAYNMHDVHVERLLAQKFAPNMEALRSTQPISEEVPAL